MERMHADMKTFDMETVEKFTGRPGFIGKFIHSEGFTFAQWEIKKGTELVFHDHPHEQTTLLLAGKMELGTADKKVTLTPGQGIVFAGGEAHGALAPADSLVMILCRAVRVAF